MQSREIAGERARTQLADCHTHLDQYPAEEIPQILERAGDAGVGLVVCAGTTVDSSAECVEMTRRHQPLYAGVGVHPMEAHQVMDEAAYGQLEGLARQNPKVVCISEIGLDFLPTSPDRDIQFQVFREQIRLALALKLPIIFHSRESHPEVFRTLREEGADAVGGAMHYFQSDEATAREAIDCGFFISLARPLLRLPELQEAVRSIPLENIVLETDAAPQPFKKHRANWTEPRHAHDVAARLAELKGVTLEEVAHTTTGNLANLLGLDPPRTSLRDARSQGLRPAPAGC